jgi:nicotinamide riboside kinase
MTAIIVNLFGPPSSGKSTVRADVFRCLKQKGVVCEEVYETAKKFVWSGRMEELAIQPYMFAKQLRDVTVLKNKVDVIVTDSPFLNNVFYNRKYNRDMWSDFFEDFVIDEHDRSSSMNFFLTPAGKYEQAGRVQNADESARIGLELRDMLDELDVPFNSIIGDDLAGPMIAKWVIEELDIRNDRNAMKTQVGE